MVTVDETLLHDPARLAAVDRARRVIFAQPGTLPGLVAFTTRLFDAPIVTVTLVAEEREYVVGAHGLPPALNGSGQAPMVEAVGGYVVSADRPVGCGDVSGEADPQLDGRPFVRQHGIRAFLGVPLRDGDDQRVGSLTVFDTRTRRWSPEQASLLADLGDLLRSSLLAGRAEPTATTGIDGTALLDSVREAFVAVNRDGLVVGWNRAAHELLGFNAAEVCGRHLNDELLPDYDGQPVGAALARLFTAAPRRRISRRVSLRHRDGHRVCAEASLSVVQAETGPLACVFLTDLAGQAAAEQKAESNGKYLAALLDSLSVGVIACDQDGQVILVNRALREVQGMPVTSAVPDDYAATTAAVLAHPDMTPMSWGETPLMRALRGQHVQAAEVLMQAPGQRVRTFASTAQPITGSDGQRLGAVVVAHEVTALRRVEQFRNCHFAVARALGEAGAPPEAALGVLQALLATLRWPYAELWLVDETGEQLQQIGQCSGSGVEIHTLGSHTVVKGVGLIGRVWASGQPLWVADLSDSTNPMTRETRSHTQNCVRAGLRTVTSVPVRDGSTTLGVLTCYSGVPEPHEDLLTVLLDGVAAQFGVYVALHRAAQLARQLDRAKDDFIALVGHELRTPLTCIAANVGMLDDDQAIPDDDSRQMVRDIQRNTEALRGIVDTLLDLAGLDAGHLTLAVREVDLSALLAHAAAAAAPLAAANGVRLIRTLPDRLTIVGDPDRLRQVADDLLSNAIKYSPDGGTVQVRLRLDGTWAEVSIIDEGIGVPADELAHLFNRFYRGSNVRHQGTPGSGLGLSRADTIVRLHGGTIALTGHQPRGTTAIVRLPRRQS